MLEVAGISVEDIEEARALKRRTFAVAAAWPT
jgi:hypothetical protein